MKFYFVLLLLMVAVSTHVSAHAFLDYSEPAVGATVSAPSQVKIWFTEKLHHATSTIQVFDSAGREVDTGKITFDPKNELEMGVSLGKLTPGSYKVVWNAVAIDTHHTHGTFAFVVRL